MRRRSLLAGLVLAPMIEARADAPTRVVATFSILADMVRQVGGTSVAARSLVPPDGDPHVYDPTPADLRDVLEAAVLVENGLGLEGWMKRLDQAGGFAGQRIIAAADVKPRSFSDDGAITIDPHAWQDPRNGVLYVRAIAAGLAKAAPGRAATLQASAARYIAQIEATDAWIEQQFAQIPPTERRIITSHDAFGYYGARFGIALLSAEGISTEDEPSAHTIAALIAQIRREKIRAVFLENMTDPRLARMLARESGAVLGGTVYSDALSPPNGPAPSYLAMLRYNTTLFVKAMRRG